MCNYEESGDLVQAFFLFFFCYFCFAVPCSISIFCFSLSVISFFLPEISLSQSAIYLSQSFVKFKIQFAKMFTYLNIFCYCLFLFLLSFQWPSKFFVCYFLPHFDVELNKYLLDMKRILYFLITHTHTKSKEKKLFTCNLSGIVLSPIKFITER